METLSFSVRPGNKRWGDTIWFGQWLSHTKVSVEKEEKHPRSHLKVQP